MGIFTTTRIIGQLPERHVAVTHRSRHDASRLARRNVRTECFAGQNAARGPGTLRPVRYGVCTNVLRSGDFETDLRWAAEAGATDVALTPTDLSGLSAGAARDALEALGLRVSSLMTGLSFLPMQDGPADEDQVDEALVLCQALGGRGVTVLSGPLNGGSVEEADRLGRHWFTRMAPRASARGLRLLVEPVHPLFRPISYVHTLRHGAQLVGVTEGSGLVLDTTHVWWDRHLRDDIAVFGNLIHAVQLADVSRAALLEQRYERCQLGRGVIPLDQILDDVRAAGYDGVCENEVRVRTPRGQRVMLVAEGRLWFERALAGDGAQVRKV